MVKIFLKAIHCINITWVDGGFKTLVGAVPFSLDYLISHYVPPKEWHQLLQVVNSLLVDSCTKVILTLKKICHVELVSQGMTLVEIPVLWKLVFIFQGRDLH